MKLVLVLSIIAYGYADKLDRAYLPPANAASSGGSPGSLTAPAVQSESFGQRFPVSGGPRGLNGFGKPITSQNGLSGQAQNNPGTATFGSAFNPVVKENTLVTSGDNGLTSTGINVPSGSNSLAPSAIQQFSSNGFSASNQNFPSSGVQSSSGPYNQYNAQGAQGLNGVAQVYNQERPQAAAERNAETLKYTNENNGESYSYSYETSNGISAEESGVATNGVMAQGGYAYTGDDGKAYSVSYTADENGYQPQGEHLPTPHPIPEEILKSIEENAKAAAAGTQEGAYRPEEYESEVSPQQNIFGSRSPYQSNPSQELSKGPTYNPPQINQYQATNQGQGFGLPNQVISQQNNQGIIQESSQSYRPRPSQSQFQSGIGEKLINKPSNFGSTTQKFGQSTQSQGSGYQYNPPQNALTPTTFTQTSASQNSPSGPRQNTFLSGPNLTGSVFKGNQDNHKPSFGNRPLTDLYGSQQSQSQFGSDQQTASPYRPLPQNGVNKPLNPAISFSKQGQENQINQAFSSQQGKPAGQGYQYQPQQQPLGFKKPSKIAGSQNEGFSNQPSYNSNNNQNQGPQSSFYGSSKPQLQESDKKPSYGSPDVLNKNSQFFNIIQNGASANNQAGQSPQFSHNANKPLLNFNQTPDKVSQYQQTGNLPNFGNRQPAQGSQLPSDGQRFATNTLAQKPTTGSRPVQAPYQYNKPSQNFKSPPSNFLPLESIPSKGNPGQGNQDRTVKFGGPRQPPSFSPQEGYKY